MSQVTIKKLLEPVRNDDPCGEYLEDHGDFYILKEMINGKEETQWSAYEPPDWKNILRMSKGLLLRGKNLWVVVFYTYASTEIYGLEGLIKGLELLKDMLDKFWDNIQPHLDPEDEDDYTLSRLSPFATMASPHEHLCTMLKTMHFIETQRIGKFSYEDIKTLADETAVRGAGLESVELEHISADIKKEKYTETVNSLKGVIKLCSEINDFITEKVGEKNNISNLNNFIKFIENIINLFSEHIKTESDVEPVFSEPTEKIVLPIQNSGVRKNESIGSETINNKKDIIRNIDEITKWLNENETGSFSAFLIDKAKDCLSMDCWKTIETMYEIKDFISDRIGNKTVGETNKNKSDDTATIIPEKNSQLKSKSVGEQEQLINEEKINFSEFY